MTKSPKRLRDIVEKYPDDYEQKTEVGQSFVALHRKKVVDKLGEKGKTENQFKGGTNVAPYKKAPQDGFPKAGQFNDYNLPTHYDDADDDDDNDGDNDHNRSKKAQEETDLDESVISIGHEHPVHALAQKYEKTGRIAHHYPKLRAYSLNGGPRKSYDKTYEHLNTFFSNKEKDLKDSGDRNEASYRKKNEEVEPLDELDRRGILTNYIHKTTGDDKRKEGRGLALQKKWGDPKYGFKGAKVPAVERKTFKEETPELTSFIDHLDESSVTRKHFREVANTVRAIEDPAERQKFADHHAAIFAKANPRFDHARFHAAAGTSYDSGKGTRANDYARFNKNFKKLTSNLPKE